jgi:hypothetical protein
VGGERVPEPALAVALAHVPRTRPPVQLGFELRLATAQLRAQRVVQQPVVVAGPAGRVLPPGYMWCSKCGGDGYNRTWYGMPKKCNICGGDGMRRIHGGKHMPPPRHVHKPAPKHPPKHVAKKPAHKPAHKPVSRPKSSKGHGRR